MIFNGVLDEMTTKRLLLIEDNEDSGSRRQVSYQLQSSRYPRIYRCNYSFVFKSESQNAIGLIKLLAISYQLLEVNANLNFI